MAEVISDKAGPPIPSSDLPLNEREGAHLKIFLMWCVIWSRGPYKGTGDIENETRGLLFKG